MIPGRKMMRKYAKESAEKTFSNNPLFIKVWRKILFLAISKHAVLYVN
jgi:hypothetical protein